METRKTRRIRSSSTSKGGGSGSRSILLQDDHLRPHLEVGAVLGELAVDRPELLRRIACRGVDHVHQQPGSLQVREELVAEPDALAGALDQSRDVRDGELPPVRSVHRAEHRLERREGVIGDLRLRVRDPASAATTCPRSATRRAPRRRAASAAGQSRPPRPACRSPRSAASGAWESRTGGCRGRPSRRGPARPERRRAQDRRRGFRRRRRPACRPGLGARRARRRRRACRSRRHGRRGRP